MPHDYDDDPLARAVKLPSVSFEPENGGHGKGEVVTFRAVDKPRILEDRDDKGQLKTFSNGDPMHKMVLTVEELQSDGTWVRKGLWGPCTRQDGSVYSELGKAQLEAQKQYGATFRVGPGFLFKMAWIAVDDAPKRKNPKNNVRKIYKIGAWKYEPSTDADAVDDPFAASATPATAESPAPANTPAAADTEPTASAGAVNDPWGSSGPAAGATNFPAGGSDAW